MVFPSTLEGFPRKSCVLIFIDCLLAIIIVCALIGLE